MNTRLLSCCLAILTTSAGAFAGPHVGIGIRIGIPAPIYVHEAPPPRVVERIYTSPGPGYIWVAGHYTWSENRWVWVGGAWMTPPEPAAYWVDGRWNADTRQWVEAHWEVPAPAPAQAQPPPGPSTSNVPVPSTPAPVVSETSEVIVQEAPPPPVREVIIASPGPGYIWIEGYWGWIGGRREWIRGHWERPPHRHAVWVSPRWENRGHGYVYVRGFWR